MRYISTRDITGAQFRSFTDVLLGGLASDGGLYVPEEYPVLDLRALNGLTYIETASYVLGLFINDIPKADLDRIIRDTYRAEVFGSAEITPMKWLKPGALGLLQLSNGPTKAFKDVPLQLLGALLDYVLRKRGEKLNILGATSGDTGAAAAYAVRGRDSMNLIMLSPEGRMSPIQRAMMYTLDEPNVHNLVVRGNFDDCQGVVKRVNSDGTFKQEFRLGAMNSINWARIAAQIVYYVYAYAQAAAGGAKGVTFAVPSGNFGNALSAYIARKMGLLINIIVATNGNDVLDEFFRIGVYRVRKGTEVMITSSPSMDIAEASNFERLVFDLTERDPELLLQWWAELRDRGQFDGSTLMADVRAGITSGSATDADVLEIIRQIYSDYHTIIDPHTAVAMKVGLEQVVFSREHPLIVAETALPVKFGDTIREALGFEPPVPEEIARLMTLPHHTTTIGPDPEAVKDYIRTHVH